MSKQKYWHQKLLDSKAVDGIHLTKSRMLYIGNSKLNHVCKAVIDNITVSSILYIYLKIRFVKIYYDKLLNKINVHSYAAIAHTRQHLLASCE